MSLALRIFLIVGALLMLAFVVLRIRKSKMRIEDSLFWVFLSILILILSIFPQIGSAVSGLFGFMAPVNFVFSFFIFVLTVKCFTLSARSSNLETRIKELTQQIAIEKLDHYERTHTVENDIRAEATHDSALESHHQNS